MSNFSIHNHSTVKYSIQPCLGVIIDTLDEVLCELHDVVHLQPPGHHDPLPLVIIYGTQGQKGLTGQTPHTSVCSVF